MPGAIGRRTAKAAAVTRTTRGHPLPIDGGEPSTGLMPNSMPTSSAPRAAPAPSNLPLVHTLQRSSALSNLLPPFPTSLRPRRSNTVGPAAAGEHRENGTEHTEHKEQERKEASWLTCRTSPKPSAEPRWCASTASSPAPPRFWPRSRPSSRPAASRTASPVDRARGRGLRGPQTGRHDH